MFRVFNMGWGFALIVRREESERCIKAIGKEFEPEPIGKAIKERKIIVKHKTKQMVL